ncbi:hypothetical protein [Silicimonas sp. MF1-12-2]|uniref:hypothetical protein n=1 Tax=Silicimonas sp. MF1-12-2 TaxID=3384793 RepID=UPI0039B54A5E
MAEYVDQYGGGNIYDVEYIQKTNGGDLARHLAGKSFDILILDLTNRRVRLNQSDKSAIQQFYSNGRNALMLDESFAIRSIRHNPRTVFPGTGGSSAGLLINQISALAKNGGGILIGTDHDAWQPNANAALSAILPKARFTGLTNPSTNGDFLADVLLGQEVAIKPRDILNHWESVPNQGEAPVGTFVDFLGRNVTLYSLVEIADKPGRGRKRPYISANFDPGTNRIPVDSEDLTFGNIPTHRSGPID